MTSFAPPRANQPVLRFFSSPSRLAHGLSADFPRTFRETGGINRETFKNLAVELYQVTTNSLNNSALHPRDSRI